MTEARKTVTVVFADVTGSTGLGERLDPGALRGVVARYFEEMRIVLEHHGATVEKFIGDAVMAVFGIPTLHEDDALRAIRAAAEMRVRLAELNEELDRERGITLGVRTGVNTGEVVAGDPTGGQFYATGDAVNVAARLEQSAAPGEILLGEETYRLVRDAVEVEPMDGLDLKGKAEVVEAWRLLAVDTQAAGFARRFDSPLVGRQDELRRLRQEYERVRDESACRLVIVVGAAGVGKSRLAAELETAVCYEARVLVGRCLSYGEGITFWPLAEIVRSLGDVGERVAAAVGLSESSMTSEEGFWVVRKLFERLAEERPLVLVFDDVHWAESTFLDLLEYVTDWSRDAAILILCLGRPELVEARPSWAVERENGAFVRLAPLSEPEAETLIANLLGSAALPADLTRRVTEAAGGNPLFVEQMHAMLGEDGPKHSDSELAVPPTIQALLAARVDRLPAAERRVLEAAAVIGKEAWRGALVELLPDDTPVSALLQALVRKEFVRPEPSSPPR